MNDREQREQESQESPKTKYQEAVVAEERERLADRVREPPSPKEENEAD